MQTLFTGKPTIHLSSVGSTNIYLKNLCAQKSLNEGYAVTAQEQTHGLGQRNKSWSSLKGQNLLCSILFRPTFLRADNSYLLNMISALAVNHLLTEMDIQSKIKWPNDIYINDRKCGGILIENRITGTSINRSIIGLGLNLNQTDFSMPGLETATSAALTKNQKYNIQDVFQRYCQIIESKYLTAKSKPHTIAAKFNASLWGKNEFRTYIHSNGEETRFKTVEVLLSGELRVMKENGNLQTFKYNDLRPKLQSSKKH